MPLGVSDDHLALHAAASRWAADRCPAAVPRALLDRDDEPLPDFWAELAGLGWLGLHVDEAHGGEGYGLTELAVVLEELGRVCAPGPFLPTVLTSSLLQRHGSAAQRDRWLPGLVEGSVRGAVAFGGGALANDAGAATDRPHASGTLRPVLGAGLAELLVVPVEIDGREHWYVLDRAEVDVTSLPSLDPTRRVAAVTADGVALSLTARDGGAGSPRERSPVVGGAGQDLMPRQLRTVDVERRHVFLIVESRDHPVVARSRRVRSDNSGVRLGQDRRLQNLQLLTRQHDVCRPS